MAIVCRVIPHRVDDGAASMALDEALLDDVAGGAGQAYLRTYGWAEPTLSLGYFQRISEAMADPRWADAPLVRRPTGGGALWHHHEITYAVVIPERHPLSRPNTRLYQAVHQALAGLLTKQGAAASRYGDDPKHVGRRKERPFLCFTDRDPEDIMVQECKVVGSAQRRRDGAILQHGSLLLARSALVPEVFGVRDVAEVARDQTAWPLLIVNELERQLGFEAEPGDVPRAVQERAVDYERTRYRNPEWTRMR
jgi:lipoate-protein ligase A